MNSALLALCAAALLGAGCVPLRQNAEQDDARFTALQDELQRVKREVSELRAHQPTALPPADDLGKKLAEIDEKVRQSDLDVQTMKGKFEEVEKALADQKAKKDSAKSEKLAGDLAAVNEKVNGLSEKLAVLAKQVEAAKLQPQPQAAPPSPGEPRNLTPLVAAPQKTSKDLYDEAYALYKENKYADAQAKFKEYIERYPDTPLTDNSYFWIGEAYYDQGQYEQAIINYDKVVQKFPDGDKVPSALLKEAFSFAAMGDNMDAKILLKKIMADHPGSEQAAIAKKKLEVLGP